MTQEKWICRTWTETAEDGWTSSFDIFNTKREAIEHGRIFVQLITYDELTRDFEIYKSFN